MAARTLAQLRTAVQSYGVGVDTATAQTEWINSAYKDLIGLRHWQFLMKTTTGSLTLATNSFAAPSDISGTSVEGIYFQDPSGVQMRPARYLDPVRLFNLTVDTVLTGAPRYWTLIGSTFYVYPTADQTYTYTLLYAQRVVMLAADGDQPLVPENYDDILVWGAVARSALRQNNWLTRDFADQQKLALINKLMASEEMHQRQTADEVETTGIWSSPDPLRDFWS